MNKWIWQQIKRCFVFWGKKVITDEKLKKEEEEKKPNMDQGLWQKEFTASGLSFCSIITLYLLSESTKAMGVREHYAANEDRKATWIT